MDRLTSEQRRRTMQAIRSSGSKIEIMVRASLWARGHRYRKNYRLCPGKPDIAFPSKKVAVFCDSEFWHGYDWKNQKNKIKSNRAFWFRKIEGNIKRDKIVTKTLRKQGWKVLRFWGSEIQKDLARCILAIEKVLAGHPPKQLLAKSDN